MKPMRDVAIIGGGPAGLSAALTLARGGRTVTVFDDNQGRNFPADHMMNFPSREGTPPEEFRKLIWNDLSKYQEVERENIRVNEITSNDGLFILNHQYQFRKILLAHGVKDILPDIPGVRELWGKAVFHCPYCHGHEYKGKEISVLNDEEKYLSHMVPLLLGLSASVTVFTNGKDVQLPAAIVKRTRIITQAVKSLEREDDELKGVKLINNEVIKMEGMVIKPPQELSTDLGKKLGCEMNEFGLYRTDADGMTSVPGIYAAGDIIHPKQAVIISCSYGMSTGASMNFALMSEKLSER